MPARSGPIYGFRDNPDIILKVGRGTSDSNKMNKDDAMLFKKYPLIAPRTYAHADDYKWIYIDNVEVAIDDIAYNNAIHDTFPEYQSILSTTNKLMCLFPLIHTMHLT